MKSVIPFVFAIGCLAFSQGASILPRTISSQVSGYNFTAEDCSAVLIVVSEDEVTYLSMLAADLSVYESFIESRTLAAYKVGQVAGNCALAVQRATVSSLTKAANKARENVISAHRAARKILTQAKTEQEIAVAVEYVEEEKIQSALYFSKVVANLSTLAAAGIKGIQNCTSPNVIN